MYFMSSIFALAYIYVKYTFDTCSKFSAGVHQYIS